MKATTAATVLAWLLRVMGGLAVLAIVAVFMPEAWIVAGAEATGVGPYPDSLLTDYLVRSVSAIYALLGALTVYLSLDVRRYADLIVFVGWLTILLGVAVTGIDFALGMPASWSWGEGPPTVVVGAAFIGLARRVREATPAGG